MHQHLETALWTLLTFNFVPLTGSQAAPLCWIWICEEKEEDLDEDLDEEEEEFNIVVVGWTIFTLAMH